MLILLPITSLADGESFILGLDRNIEIILPDTPSQTETFAANELARYLEAIRGTPVQFGYHSDYAYQLYVGNTFMADEWMPKLTDKIPETAQEVFVIATDSSQTVLAGGGDRGTLYSVYAFLEDLGCRWLEPGPQGEFIPQRTTIGLQNSERIERPAMTIRHLGTSGQFAEPANKQPKAIRETVDWMVKNRLNFSFALRPQVLYRQMPPGERNLWDIRGGMVEWQHIVHNFPMIIPNEVYFEEHPEYFASYKGRRIPVGPEMGNLALTHPEVRRVAAEFAANWFDQHPQGTVVPMVPPDGAIKWDESPEAMKLGGKNFVQGSEGSMSRRMAEFSAAVAEQLIEDYPNRYILNLAYSNYVEPYPGLTLPSNVIAQVAHGYAGQGSFVHSIYHDRNAEARKIFEGWANSGAGGIGIWDYFILHVPDRAGSPKTPLGFANITRDMIGYLKALKPAYKVYFTQAGNEHWQYNAFLYWAVARLTWNPDQSVESLAREWAQAAFGKAWEPGYRYLNLLETAYDNDEWGVKIWREINVPSPLIFDEAFLSSAQENLSELKQNLSPHNHLGQDLAERMQTSITFAENAVAPAKIFGKHGVWKITRGENSYTLNADGADHLDQQLLMDSMSSDHSTERTLSHLMFRAKKREEPILWLENRDIKVGVIPGIGGRMIRIIDRSTGQNLLHEPKQDSLENPGAPYFRYGGYEEYTGNAFASPGWETPMRIVSHNNYSLTLTGYVDGLTIKRNYSLSKSIPTKLTINTQLRNETTEARPTRIRVHPEFKLDEHLDETRLLIKRNGKPFEDFSLYHSDALDTPDEIEQWGVYSPMKEIAVLNSFQYDQIEKAHLHLDPNSESFNLELFGAYKNLLPGESLTLEHRYEIIRGRESDKLLGANKNRAKTAVKQNEANPSQTPISEIQTKDISYQNGDIPISLDGVPVQIGKSGALQCEFYLNEDPATIKDSVLFSFGSKSPDWMIARFSQGKFYLYRTRGNPPFDAPDEGWSKLMVETTGLIEPNTWHRLILGWNDTGPGAQDQLYIILDDQLIDERNDLVIRPVTNAPSLMIGGNSRAINNGRFNGNIRNIQIYDHAFRDNLGDFE
ncbi:DUF4838 domain-containing protein [Cerasicoccus maritimus]|uniref:DUF4838 domain-containing protein n=1 Tax=Cerasicoccus maritimus TaxID=490089 RepID=UPI002852CB81|nr:DUF4838 domain-containing protein [Cerasicoccus maritimus]